MLKGNEGIAMRAVAARHARRAPRGMRRAGGRVYARATVPKGWGLEINLGAETWDEIAPGAIGHRGQRALRALGVLI